MKHNVLSILGVQFSCMNYISIAVGQISRTFSTYKTETLYLQRRIAI